MGLIYPSDLPPDYHFSLTFKTYSMPDPFTGTVNLTQGAWGPNEVGGAHGSIRLPIPANIVDSQNLRWETGPGLAGQFGRDVASLDWGNIARDATSGAASVLNALDRAFDAFTGGRGLGTPATMKEAFNRGGQSLAGSAVGPLLRSVFQNAGLAVNPVLTQQFTNPEFKTHDFIWKFSPDSPEESSTLEAMVGLIANNALPGTVGNGFFFTYPSICLVRIVTGQKDLYKFQPCVITNYSVNYAGSGVPSFYSRTSSPTTIELKLSLLEIILNTTNNHKNPSGFESSYNFNIGTVGQANLENLEKFL